jgi:hypothetical protein
VYYVNITGEAVDATPAGVHIGGMVRDVELVLDAEVLELVQHIVRIVRLLTQLVQQLAP